MDQLTQTRLFWAVVIAAGIVPYLYGVRVGVRHRYQLRELRAIAILGAMIGGINIAVSFPAVSNSRGVSLPLAYCAGLAWALVEFRRSHRERRREEAAVSIPAGPPSNDR